MLFRPQKLTLWACGYYQDQDPLQAHVILRHYANGLLDENNLLHFNLYLILIFIIFFVLDLESTIWRTPEEI